jgi:radical SAM-linked protein
MRSSPDDIFGNRLLEVEKPARYLGGEYGIVKKEKADYRVALSFPDLYEIGMSNQAVKILYRGLNAIDGLACERVFSPDLDYEALLRKSGIPLCSLENGIPLRDMDMVAFTVGYELCGTGILTILDLGGVPLFARERTEGHPLVIGGGMALTNPSPFSEFFDAIWIGEAEAGFFELMNCLLEAKRSGATRSALLDAISAHPAVWRPGKKARRAVFSSFGSVMQKNCLPVATVRPVQDHGVVEIMRGCPNGCRFCHAGYAYRPTRMKSPELILEEVKDRIRCGGHREITLSSLSSGDYDGIESLLKGLSSAFAPELVSFQLPSLRVSTFNLPLIESLSLVRKSGLTFAVETPRAEWQSAMNKDVSREKVLEILDEARKQGWKSAKFYFMIGLPAAPSASEEVDEIYGYLMDLQRASRFEFNVNIGVFVPKAHTPFERAAQLPESEAMECFLSLKRRLPPRIRMSFHSPFISTLEGLISRGDVRSGKIILDAFLKGLRLEAWEEHREMDAWREIISLADPEYVESVLAKKEEKQELPWDSVDVGVSSGYLAKERIRSEGRIYTPVCSDDCADPCGSCNAEYGKIGLKADYAEFDRMIGEYSRSRPGREGEGRFRMLFAFSKKGIGRFYPHLTVVDALSKAFARADLPISHTQGFNPQPKLEIAHPLAMGVESEAEIACVEVYRELSEEEFLGALNDRLPEGLKIEFAACFRMRDGLKNLSLASLFKASSFSIQLSGNFVGKETELLQALASYPTVIKAETCGDSELRCIVLTGKTKEEQPLSPFKKAISDSLSEWPRIVRNECLCSPFQEAGDHEDATDLTSFKDYFSSYYGVDR